VNENDPFDENDPYNTLVELIEYEIEIITEKVYSNIRLNFSLLDNEEEKTKYTEKVVRKLKKEVASYNGLVSRYIIELISSRKEESNIFFVEHNLVYNFISETIEPEEFEIIKKNKEISFADFFEQCEFRYPNIENFIKGFAFAKEYLAMKTMVKSDLDSSMLGNSSKIKWNGSQTELIELIKALIENNSIKGQNQKNTIYLFSKFLKMDIKNPDKIIQDVKKRNNGSETLFLDKLKTTLYDYIQKESTR
jgi:hypothetical protein